MREKKSRFEVNKDVRRVLTRNGADTNQLGFQVYGREVSLYGTLIHGDGSDFGALEIEVLLTDFAGTLPGFNITGETSNWSFSHQGIRKLTASGEEKATVVMISEDDEELDN